MERIQGGSSIPYYNRHLKPAEKPVVMPESAPHKNEFSTEDVIMDLEEMKDLLFTMSRIERLPKDSK